MEAQQFWHLSFISTWIFVFLFPSVCSGMDAPTIHLTHTVFVAFAGDALNIDCDLKIPANQSRGILTCSDPSDKKIYSCDIVATTDQPKELKLVLELKNLTSSGEYCCQYQTAQVYWFLRVRDAGYKDLKTLDYTEIIIVVIITAVLLVFSVIGSVYVFTGRWKACIIECGDTGRKPKQNREERKERKTEEANVDETAQSTSFYASLEPRPRSIYDVLDHSAANREPDQSKAKPKKKTMAQTREHQDEDVFESVYENL